ncbi:MAG: Dam family site-specific DNA-(adenine-N6)-methyltransferase, partial [Clostridia bacterium]|nr:Dam family site-specific DNA-(adenine-N6)-methyltransferase [Clostridia bacterium]
MANRVLRPIIKWVGGKGQLLEDISRRYPAGLGTTIRKYAEPFIGGGAVLFDILTKYTLDEIYISDCNAELINMYRKVKTDVQVVVECLQELQAEYFLLNDDGRKELYYAKRDRYNELIRSGESKDSVEAAVLFIFLNKTCFNGLY